MRGNDAIGRQRETERLRVGWRNGDDLATGDQAAIDVLVCPVVMPLVLRDRPAECGGDVVCFGVWLARGRGEEKRLFGHGVPFEKGNPPGAPGGCPRWG